MTHHSHDRERCTLDPAIIEQASQIHPELPSLILRATESIFAVALAFISKQATAPVYVHEKDEDILERCGLTGDNLARAARTGKVAGAIRTPSRGWKASVEAVNAYLAERRKPKKRRSTPKLVAVVTDERAADRALLAAAGGMPRRAS